MDLIRNGKDPTQNGPGATLPPCLKLEQEEAWLKIELEKKKIQDAANVEQEKVSLARFTEDSRIMFQDASLLDEPSAKWILHMKKKISERDLVGQ